MASCEKCGKPIGLLEYVLGDSRQIGLCKKCRKTQKWCDNCVYLLKISMENSSVIRCIKYGYEMSKKKDWAAAAKCPDFTPKIKGEDKNKRQKKNNKTKTFRVPVENNPFQTS